MKMTRWIGVFTAVGALCWATPGWSTININGKMLDGTIAEANSEGMSGSFTLTGTATADEGNLTFVAGSADSSPAGVRLTNVSGSTMVNQGMWTQTFSYTVGEDYCNDNIQDKAKHTITFNGLTNATVIMVFNVACVNDPPVPEPLALSTPEDTALQVMLKATDPDMNDMLVYRITTMPAAGTLTGTAPNLVYRPNANYSGMDTIGFEVEDSAGAKAQGSVSITVTPVNDAPEVMDEQINISQDMMASINLTATDADGDLVSFTVTKQPTSGSLQGAAPSFQYTPNPGFSGTDTIKFKARDPQGLESSEATITINIGNVNDPPMFVDPTPADMTEFMIDEGENFSFKIAATDPDNDTLTLALTGTPSGATFDAATGEFKWRPIYSDKGEYMLTASVKDAGAPITRGFKLIVNTVDEDNDYIPSTLEEELGLNPKSNDSDGDRISDTDEVGNDFENPLDSNNNGIIDALDLDSDGDGLTDAQEAGDESVSTKPVDSDGDGQPDYRDKDSDNDGVEDSNDNCKTKRNADQKDTDGDRIGDVCDDDVDNDGLANGLDSCPDVSAMTTSGCPPRATPSKSDEDEGCAAAGTNGPSIPGALLAMFGAALLFWRRRRA